MVDPLGRPTESCLTPFPARSSPHVDPPAVACGRAAVGCGCLLVKRHTSAYGAWPSLDVPLEGTQLQSDRRRGSRAPGDLLAQEACVRGRRGCVRVIKAWM